MNTLLIIIIAFLALDFFVELLLTYLNGKCMGKPIPNVLKGLYDDEKYAKQQAYQHENRVVGTIEECMNFVIILALLILGVFGIVDNWAKSITSSPALQIVLFMGVFNLFSTLIELSFSYYSTFVIEEKYGFNKTTKCTFWLDTIKSFFLSLIITCGILILIYQLYQWIGQDFWIWATIACAAVILFFTLFYSNVIVPLFNKQTPLEAGELRDKIEHAIAQAGQRFKDIYVINGSKHSTKANAYFTGFGPKKRIVLYDTLIEQLTPDEIVAVLSHELGHYSHHDTITGMIKSIAMIAVYMFTFSLFVSNQQLPVALGGQYPSFVLSLFAFLLLITPINLVIDVVFNIMSRRAEYRADAFATRLGHGEQLILGLKKLSANTLSNLTPHPVVVFVEYSHPTLAQRIIAINNIMK